MIYLAKYLICSSDLLINFLNLSMNKPPERHNQGFTVPDGRMGGGGLNPKGGGKNLLFGQIFPENCVKMKEIWSRGRTSLAPP